MMPGKSHKTARPTTSVHLTGVAADNRDSWHEIVRRALDIPDVEFSFVKEIRELVEKLDSHTFDFVITDSCEYGKATTAECIAKLKEALAKAKKNNQDSIFTVLSAKTAFSKDATFRADYLIVKPRTEADKETMIEQLKKDSKFIELRKTLQQMRVKKYFASFGPSYFDDEAWVKSHAAELRRDFLNEWVVVQRSKVICHSSDRREIDEYLSRAGLTEKDTVVRYFTDSIPRIY